MTLIVIVNIFSRYFLNYAISWAEEISRYLMVWMVMLGAAMGVRLGTHFRMEMIENVRWEKGKAHFPLAHARRLFCHGLCITPSRDDSSALNQLSICDRHPNSNELGLRFVAPGGVFDDLLRHRAGC